MDQESLREELVNYCDSRFPGLLATLTQDEEDEFLRDIVLVLLARKRNRNLDYLPSKEDSCWDECHIWTGIAKLDVNLEN